MKRGTFSGNTIELYDFFLKHYGFTLTKDLANIIVVALKELAASVPKRQPKLVDTNSVPKGLESY